MDGAAIVRALRRLRYLFRPPRRLRVLRSGGFLIGGTLLLGLATLNTGNNLLYLLLGALLGTIALSGWLSEQTLRDVRIRRYVPAAITAGEAIRIEYAVENGSTRTSSHGLEIRELVASGPGARPAPVLAPAYVPVVEAGQVARAHSEFRAARRGVYQLDGVTLATSFPFGLFRKERDIPLVGALLVWPRTDRAVRVPAPSGRRGKRQRAGSAAVAAGGRGDYRGLRDYRAGDDPRDIHWRTSARRGVPIVREYEHESADEYWIVLDTVARDEESGERAVEIAAALVADAARRGDRYGFATTGAHMRPATAPGRAEAALDVLASVVMSPHGPAPAAPAPAWQCVLVTARAAVAGEWGDTFNAAEQT